MMATDLIDFERYPLDDPSSVRRSATVEQARAGLRADGCAVIPDLVRPDALQRLHAEIEASVHDAHFSTNSMNPYFRTDPTPPIPIVTRSTRSLNGPADSSPAMPGQQTPR
jgi:hypothetical protein